MKKNNLFLLLSFSVLMILTGISDSLRGVFLPTFQTHFALSSTQSSMIIMVSYIGNLIFLLIGGKLVDKYQKKPVILCILGIWSAAFLLYTVTDNYWCLLFGMIFSMGASTLLSTTLNILTPVVFLSSPGLIVNLLGFIQGIGTSGSQNMIGRFAENISAWHISNGVMLAITLLMIAAFLFIRFPERVQTARVVRTSYRETFRNPAFPFLVIIFGFYFIAEHGIMNWMTTYATQELGMSLSDGSMYLSFFFLGYTIGRLVLSPLVDRLGIFRCFGIISTLAAALYIPGILFGRSTILLVCISGFFFSILYPTLVLMVNYYYPAGTIATAAGAVISTATLFDILFNLFFGTLIDVAGFHNAIYVLPISMGAFWLFYLIFRKAVKPIREIVTEKK